MHFSYENMILAVIQARISSTRLTGKVLLPILGKPIILHIFERLKFSKKIDKICISTSDQKSDDPLVEFAQKNGIAYHRGSEKNLVERHLGAARKFNANAVVRITADCPLVDPDIVDQIIDVYEKNLDVDFVSNTKIRTYPVGLDVELIPTKTLERLLPISDNTIFYEYFISMYIYEHSKKFKSLGIQLEHPNLLRWTLDYPEDYEFLKQIFSHLYKDDKVFHMNDIMSLLETKPELISINSMHNSQFSHLKYSREKGN